MREGMHEPFEFFSLKNIIIAIHVTKLSGLTLASFWTWVWIFSSFSPNQFFKNHASNLTSLISFQNPSLNTKVEPKELQHLCKLKRTHPKLWWTLYQNILLNLPYLFSCDSAQFLQERIPHREQREASVLYYFLSNFFCWESERVGKWMGVLKAQCQGVFGVFLHLKANPWPRWGIRQTCHTRHPMM